MGRPPAVKNYLLARRCIRKHSDGGQQLTVIVYFKYRKAVVVITEHHIFNRSAKRNFTLFIQRGYLSIHFRASPHPDGTHNRFFQDT